MLRMATRPDWCGDPLQGRFILDNLGGPLDYMEHYPLKLAHFDEYLTVEGDHPLNLSATVLALNAHMLGHEGGYKEWLLEYVDAWKARIAANGGNIPTNIGLDRSIGGVFGGRWWGGTYGWNFHPWSPEHGEQHFRNLFDKGTWPGFGNALLLTGDNRRYRPGNRSTLQQLWDAGCRHGCPLGVRSPRCGAPRNRSAG